VPLPGSAEGGLVGALAIYGSPLGLAVGAEAVPRPRLEPQAERAHSAGARTETLAAVVLRHRTGRRQPPDRPTTTHKPK
jgi:hypothetical protein